MEGVVEQSTSPGGGELGTRFKRISPLELAHKDPYSSTKSHLLIFHHFPRAHQIKNPPIN
jgi:hypothetical protein